MDVWECLYMYLISMDHGCKIHNQLNFGGICSRKQGTIVGVVWILMLKGNVVMEVRLHFQCSKSDGMHNKMYWSQMWFSLLTKNIGPALVKDF